MLGLCEILCFNIIKFELKTFIFILSVLVGYYSILEYACEDILLFLFLKKHKVEKRVFEI